MSIAWNAFTPVSALIGGSIVGAAVALFVVLNGRIAGVSGILGGLARPQAGDISWREVLRLHRRFLRSGLRVRAGTPRLRDGESGEGARLSRPRWRLGSFARARYGGSRRRRRWRLRADEEEDPDAARCAGAHPGPAPHRPAPHLRQPRVRRRL